MKSMIFLILLKCYSRWMHHKYFSNITRPVERFWRKASLRQSSKSMSKNVCDLLKLKLSDGVKSRLILAPGFLYWCSAWCHKYFHFASQISRQLETVRGFTNSDKPETYTLQGVRPCQFAACRFQNPGILAVHVQTNSFVHRTNLIPAIQSGFRKHHSTSTALTTVPGNILRPQDWGDSTVLILVGLFKAFDTISHEVLLE